MRVLVHVLLFGFIPSAVKVHRGPLEGGHHGLALLMETPLGLAMFPYHWWSPCYLLLEFVWAAGPPCTEVSTSVAETPVEKWWVCRHIQCTPWGGGSTDMGTIMALPDPRMAPRENTSCCRSRSDRLSSSCGHQVAPLLALCGI